MADAVLHNIRLYACVILLRGQKHLDDCHSFLFAVSLLEFSECSLSGSNSMNE